MFDYGLTEFRIRLAECRIKDLKMFFRVSLGILILSAACVFFDWYAYKTNVTMTRMTILFMGAIIGNMVWITSDMLTNIRETKWERAILKALIESRNQDEYIVELENMKGAKKQYEETIKYYTDPTYASIVSRENKQQVSKSQVAEK